MGDGIDKERGIKFGFYSEYFSNFILKISML